MARSTRFLRPIITADPNSAAPPTTAAHHGSIRIGAHDDVFKLRDLLQSSQGVELILEGLPGGRRCLADLAGGRLLVLLLDRIFYVGRREPQIGQPGRIEPDPHGIFAQAEILDVRHPRDPGQRIGDVNVGVVLHKARIVGSIGGYQADRQQHVGRMLLDGEPDLVHLGRKFGQGLVAAGQELHLADILIKTHIEGHRDGRIPVVGAGGGHVDHARRPVDLFFKGGGHRTSDHIGPGTDVLGGHLHLGGHQGRILGDGQDQHTNGPGHNHNQGDGHGEDGTLDEKIHWDLVPFIIQTNWTSRQSWLTGQPKGKNLEVTRPNKV